MLRGIWPSSRSQRTTHSSTGYTENIDEEGTVAQCRVLLLPRPPPGASCMQTAKYCVSKSNLSGQVAFFCAVQARTSSSSLSPVLYLIRFAERGEFGFVRG